MSDGDRRRGESTPADPELPYARTVHTPASDVPATLAPDPDGTLDLPITDQVTAAGALDPGQLIGRFVVRARLGEGGMGIVLAGHDTDLNRSVAIKLVRSEVDHPAYRARLLREAQAMARLEHPNVARVYEVGSDRGRLFVAMELIDGVTLSTWLRVQRRPWQAIVAMFHQVGAGLAAVHRVGLIHRDFKPDNVLVDRDGRARVVDFGLARLDRDQVSSASSPELAASLTRTGMMMGTPGYMAPEQQYGGTVDARVDQYSYCVALREALLGVRHPRADVEPDWAGTPRPIRAAIARGLSYEPSERYPAMDELLVALGSSNRRTALIVALAGTVAAAGVVVALIVTSSGAERASPSELVVATDRDDAAIVDAGAIVHAESIDATSRVVGPRLVDAGALQAVTPFDAAATRTTIVLDAGTRHIAVVPDAAGGLVDANAVAIAPADANLVAGPDVDPAILGRPMITRPGRPLPKPAAWTSDPGHLAVVRATIKDLGYDGFDPSMTADQVDQLSGTDQAIAKVQLGMALRRRGQCGAAESLWEAATKLLGRSSVPVDTEWHARAQTGLALCALAAGRNAQDLANKGFVHGNRDQVRFVLALAIYENGDIATAHAMFLLTTTLADPPVQRALQTWLAGTGLTLP